MGEMSSNFLVNLDIEQAVSDNVLDQFVAQIFDQTIFRHSDVGAFLVDVIVGNKYIMVICILL